MTSRPDSTCVVALAAPGESSAAAALAALAIDDRAEHPVVSRSEFGDAIDAHGGRIRLPYGHGHCLVARDQDTVVGMLYTTPPIRWLDSQPAVQRASLTAALVEIELLAVAAAHRNHGVGTALLEAAEESARDAGTHLALAKVRIGAFPTMRWYRRRGYTLAAQGEPVLFLTRGGPASCDDGNDGYQLAVKPLQPGTAIRRRARNGITALVAEHDR